MQMTSGRAAVNRRLTSAKAAWTRNTSARSSDGGRISSCGVCAQAKAATRGMGSRLPAAEETAVAVFHPAEAEDGHAIAGGRRDLGLEVRAVVRRDAADHPRLGAAHHLPGGIETVDPQAHAHGAAVGLVVDVAADFGAS